MGLQLRTSVYRRIKGNGRRQRFSELILRRSIVIAIAIFLTATSILSISHPTDAVANDWYINGWDKLSNGGGSICGMSSGKGYCWGAMGTNANSGGIHPNPELLQMTGELTGKTLADIQTHGYYACALASGKIYCWGYSTAAGQMGRGEQQYSTTVNPTGVDTSGVLNGKTISSMSLGDGYMCAVADGEAYCWGKNDGGRLGNGTNDDALYPVPVDTSGVLQNKHIDGIYAGAINTCALAEGKAYCWGYNAYGGNGDGSTTTNNSPVAVDTSGVLSGKTISSISMGQSSACVLANGGVYCWGSNFVGNLGDGTTAQSSSPVAVDTSGVLSGKVVDSMYGGDSVCAVAEGKAYCWGSNTSGQLGDGTTTQRNSPVAVDTSGVLAGKTITQAYGSGSSSCALADRIAYCWGNNQNGQLGLGLGSLDNRLFPQKVVTPSTRIDSVQSARMLINAPDDSYLILLQGQDLQYVVSAKIGGEPSEIFPATDEFTMGGYALALRAPLKTQPGDYSVEIELTNSDGSTTTYQTTLTYQKDAPTLVLASPNSSFIEGSNATSTIIGDNFTKDAEFYVGGKKAIILDMNTNGAYIQIPASNVTGKVDLEVKTENGQVTLPDAYEYKSKYPSYGLLPNKLLKTFGSQGSGNGQLNRAQNLIIDTTTGDMYVSDTDNSRIVVYDDNGNYLRQFGAHGTNDDQFDWISAMRFGMDGNLYILDSNASKIKVFNKDGTFVRAFGGQGTTEEGKINYAEAMEIDSTGNLYIPQCGWDSQAHKAIASVEVFSEQGTFIKRFEKSEPSGNDSCLYAIAINSNGEIYVYDDMWSQNQNANRILVFNSDGQYLRQFGSVGNGQNQFSFVEDMTIDSYGNILVLDSDNNRLQVYDKYEHYVGQIGVEGSGPGEFEYPRSVTVNSRNEIVILDSDNNRVQFFEGMKQISQPVTMPASEPIKKAPVSKTTKNEITENSTVAEDKIKLELEQNTTINGDISLTSNPVITKRPTFSGVAAPFANIVITIHSDPVVCKTTADAEGKWSCTLDRDLPAGNHHVTIELTNQDGTKTTLGPYAVEVKGGDTVNSDASLVPDKNTSKVVNKDQENSLFLYLEIAAIAAISAVLIAIFIRKRVRQV
jgi:alpha-tubulin suppressor-like RCC1 family protein